MNEIKPNEKFIRVFGFRQSQRKELLNWQISPQEIEELQRRTLNVSVSSLNSKSSQNQDKNLLSVGFPGMEVKIGEFRGQPVFVWKFLTKRNRGIYTNGDFNLLREV